MNGGGGNSTNSMEGRKVGQLDRGVAQGVSEVWDGASECGIRLRRCGGWFDSVPSSPTECLAEAEEGEEKGREKVGARAGGGL